MEVAPNFHVILLNPEIAGNTGNIIRLCSNTNCALHLIEPLGFELDDARLRRAGLDYHEYSQVQTHDSLSACLEEIAPAQVLAFSARAETAMPAATFIPGTALLFGPESTGLPSAIPINVPQLELLRIPMQSRTRSLNLSNAVAVAVYEGLRQLDYPLT